MKSPKTLSKSGPDGQRTRAMKVAMNRATTKAEPRLEPELGSDFAVDRHRSGVVADNGDIRRAKVDLHDTASADEPIADEPIADEPIADEPIADEPIASVLVVEDDPELRSAIKRYLNERRFLVTAVQNGKEALRLLLDSDDPYDAVVLDILLPGLDGGEVCRRARGAGCWVPIVMVTALGEIDDRIDGFQRGADDYLVKPFSLEELSLRLRALIRRSEATWVSMLSVGDLRMNLHTRQAWRGEVELNITHREFQLLELFLRHPGLVLSRNIIRSAVWGSADAKDVSGNLIDQYIAHLRRKIDQRSDVSSIETLSRIGYRLRSVESD